MPGLHESRRQCLTGLIDVKAIVKEIKFAGAVVKIPGHGNAWLPAQEMFADFRPHEKFGDRARHLLNQEIEVVEIGTALGQGHKLVSHVRVMNDPWSSVALWNNGEIKVMEVTAVTKERAIGLIPPGVRAEAVLGNLQGLLPPSWGSFGKPLIGDELAGVFRTSGVDAEKRSVVLDTTGYVRSHVHIADVLRSTNYVPTANDRTLLNSDSEADVPFFQNTAVENINSVLVVDDDESFRTAVSGFLASKGCAVVACGTKDEALTAVSNREVNFDLAIIDVQLSGVAGMEGLDVARALHLEEPNCPIVIISGLELELENPCLAHIDLRIFRFIAKPFGYEELYEALTAFNTTHQPPLQVIPGGAPKTPEPCSLEPHPSEYYEIQRLADHVRKGIHAEAVLLFSLHPVSYTAHIVAKSDPHELISIVKPRIENSPLADVAIRGRTIQTDDATTDREYRRHRLLQQAYGYRSCIGIPVQLGVGSDCGHALFAFHRQPSCFDSEHKRQLQETAHEMGYLLRIAALNSDLQQEMPFVIMGKIYGCMAHDLSNALSLDIRLRELLALIASGRHGNDPDLVRILKGMERDARQARGIVKTFREMARGTLGEVSEFCVAGALTDITHRFEVEAHNYGIQLRLIPYRGAPCLVQMRKSGFELVLYNLLLNAAQQLGRMGDLRRNQGEIAIELRCRVDNDDRQWADIFVHDNGPGIHKRDYNRIFEVHYTTKEEGCGMGLGIARTISRNVVLDERCGEVKVHRSILLTGTTFEVNLPAR